MTKLHLIWNIIRGKGVMYHMTIHVDLPLHTTLVDTENMGAWVIENTFIWPKKENNEVT